MTYGAQKDFYRITLVFNEATAKANQFSPDFFWLLHRLGFGDLVKSSRQYFEINTIFIRSHKAPTSVDYISKPVFPVPHLSRATLSSGWSSA